ncbi:MAG: restriction endonuclease subunit S [Desulfobacterales bacterium]|nr:restriction endonuclease subunit S [Desulfobacterales bacterium]
MPIALSKFDYDFIISPAYDVFEIIDETLLLPEYLMMWFSRPEFDRNSWFFTDTDVRGKLGWDSFCDMQLPIPDIAKQKAIVKEHNTIANRIKLNEKLNQKLEETAQAIYKEWFVDFNFPMTTEQAEALGKPELEGKPYKANGGEMVWNEELGSDIPLEWGVEPFTKVVNLKGGGTPSTSIKNYWNGNIPFFTPSDVSCSFYSIITEKNITQFGLQNCSSRLYPKDTVFVTARGTVGAVAVAGKEMAMNQSCYAILGFEKFNQFFVHQLTLYTVKKLKKEALGAVFNALVTKDFDGQSVVEPKTEIVKLFGRKNQYIYDYILSQVSQNIMLYNYKALILSKMTKV